MKKETTEWVIVTKDDEVHFIDETTANLIFDEEKRLVRVDKGTWVTKDYVVKIQKL